MSGLEGLLPAQMGFMAHLTNDELAAAIAAAYEEDSHAP